MKHIRTPDEYENHGCAFSVFLAGSISSDEAIDWQQMIADSMQNSSVALLNPRSSNWIEPETTEAFKMLVDWDWDAMLFADYVVVYFDANTQSPVSMMELGMLVMAKPDKTVVVCPDEFWRSKHVNALCERHGIHTVKDIYGVLDFFNEST